jgi:hypothetical protein
MRDIREHLKDRIQAGFTVGKTTSNKIILFDLDDTIIDTVAEIGVVKGGKLIKRLPNAEFNDYVLGPGESFDFGEFDDPILLDQSPFTKYWNTLKREYKKGTHIGILTARSDCKMIKDFFLKNGIRIKDELVIAINDPSLGLTGSIQQKKTEAIRILASVGYDCFVFFDDNEPNLKSAKSLEKQMNIKVTTVKV